jgi:hypothetical protein
MADLLFVNPGLGAANAGPTGVARTYTIGPAERGPSILQVAIKTDDGIIHTLPRPARHGDIIGHLWRLYPAAAGRSASDFGTQGFLLTDGTFVDRADGWIIAVARDQLLTDARARDVPHLFTEDLW